MNLLFCHLVGWPFLAGLICRIIPEKTRLVKEFLALVTSLALFIFCLLFFSECPAGAPVCCLSGWIPGFLCDTLACFTGLAVSFFGLVISVYSIGFMPGKEFTSRYYAYLLWTLSAGIGAVFAGHWVVFAVCWGFLGVTLYLMVGLGEEKAALPAKKTFIIMGGSDSFLLLGVALLWQLTGSLDILQPAKVQIVGGLGISAFLCLLVAALAKAGAMPFHTWIPEISETAPVPVLAFLPASLDKLLGIYLLARICLQVFQFHEGLWLLLRVIGAVTVVAAVFMALVQHNMKKLLSYHAVSQVGYMVLGIGAANPIGIAGGLFHMVNHAVYKCALFLGAGNVEEKTKTAELENLGGLGKCLPATFAFFLIGSLAISGVPPFNGFFSKWMVYQGLFEGAKDGNISWVLCIIAAMIGSALTLASFMKIIHSVFLGHLKNYPKKPQEVSAWMVLPGMVLAVICLVFGAGYVIPVNIFLEKVVPGLSVNTTVFLVPAVILMIGALIIGLLGYLAFASIKYRKTTSFVGGEAVRPAMAMSGTEFYRTIEEEPFLARLYAGARKKLFDVYEVGKTIVFYIGGLLQTLHTGVLPTYLSWILFGSLILLVLFLKV